MILRKRPTNITLFSRFYGLNAEVIALHRASFRSLGLAESWFLRERLNNRDAILAKWTIPSVIWATAA